MEDESWFCDPTLLKLKLNIGTYILMITTNYQIVVRKEANVDEI